MCVSRIYCCDKTLCLVLQPTADTREANIGVSAHVRFPAFTGALVCVCYIVYRMSLRTLQSVSPCVSQNEEVCISQTQKYKSAAGRNPDPKEFAACCHESLECLQKSAQHTSQHDILIILIVWPDEVFLKLACHL